MKRVSGNLSIGIVIYLLVVVLSASGAWAKPTTPEQAKSVVMNWLGLEALPMGAPLGNQFKEVKTFNYGGNPAYYVVYLNPAGMVFVPADDLVEPIIGFLPEGVFDPSPANPLGALVSQDIPGRVLKAREVEAQSLEALGAKAPQAVAQRKWAWLENPASGTEAMEAGLPSISDVRVASFVMSRWSQTTWDNTLTGLACYNYYTPPNAAGDTSNYPCGCVATAMAQLMRYWQYPASPVVGTFSITVDGTPRSATIRGGNGSGGNYAWSSMVLDPLNSGVNLTQRQAIGALTFDAGISVEMDYEYGNSGAPLPLFALVDTFRYSNSKFGWDFNDNIPDALRNAMVNPNLHAKYPILFGIEATGGGHAIVCDGYGYNAATMYHHLNMGWSGHEDAWYNLPNIDTSLANFNTISVCVYNVYTSGSGEIIAGRVTNSSGTTPISGASVSATGGYTATTDAKGIYALVKLPSYTTYTVNVTKPGYTFSPRTVSTGASEDMTFTTGNLWGIDFVGAGSKKSIEGVYQLLLMN